MQMMLQGLLSHKLTESQAALPQKSASKNNDGDAFLKVLGDVMHPEMKERFLDVTAVEELTVEDLLAALFQNGEALIEEFKQELNTLFKKESFEWSGELAALLNNFPKEVQDAAESLNDLSGDEALQQIENWLSGDIEILPAETKEQEKLFAESIAGLFGVLNQVQNNKNLSSADNQKAVPPELNRAITSLANTIFQGKTGEFTDIKKAVEQLTRWTENQMNSSSKQSVEQFVQQLNKISEAESSNKSNFLQQLLQRGIPSSESSLNNTLSAASSQDNSGMMTKVKMMVMHLGENKTEHARGQEFVKQLQNLLGKSSLQSFKNGTQELSLKLHPEHLGRVDIKLVQQNGQINAQLLTTTKTARDIVESQIQQLRHTLTQQNIQVDKIEITQQQPSYLQQEDQQKKQRNHEPPLYEQEEDQSEGENNHSFAEMLEEMTINEQA
ncbi:flagellar hook-length control protein FliK [Alteribacillus sp. JSM 102045]|uniref:flagellar hook-length control protein FliK n=1 Tax=Alteribacillus sp. JSM 102045 TaxID=1562101 RepID=UPI0035C02A5F